MDADEYRAANDSCELCGILRLNSRRHPATELHHVYHASQRYDFLGNWIMLCGSAHRWCHAHPRDGLIFCWLIKVGKNELCHREWNQSVGRSLYAVAGRQDVETANEWRKRELLAVLQARGADQPFQRA